VHALFAASGASGPDDWSQFRGPGALGRSAALGTPLHWSDTSNVVWKTALPGPGASSPITFGGRIYLTCFTGYAASSSQPGSLESLKRHLLCLDPTDGRILWNTAVPAELPEQDRIREDHGYASSTPVADAERVYTFFGRSGVFAFSHEGKQLWRTEVGSTLNGWGSAASPILLGDLLLVNASVESESLVAHDRTTGREVWRAGGIKESWHAPVVLDAPGGKSEVVMAMFRKIQAFDPANGAPLWHCDTGINWYMCPTPVAENGIVYSIGGRNPNGGLAIRAGGRGDVASSHLVWKLNKGSNVPSPILYEGHLYFAHENLGVVYCARAADGKLVYEERLDPSPGQIYASPVVADGRIYYTGRAGRTVVVAATPKFAVLAANTLEGNRGVFNASPAFHGNRLLLRSNSALYCLGTR
jgi:outer membrane protein assembly factor BamB